MARLIKTKEEIQELIKAETANHPDCGGSYFGGVYWHEPDDSGCNWSISTINGDDWRACMNAMREYVTRLRTTINVPDER